MRRLLAALACACLAGCAQNTVFQPAERVRYAQDAGSVTVSEVAVLPWADAAPLLQPTFKIDAASALAMAVPTTQSMDERFASLLQASLGVGLPTSSRTRTVTRTGKPGELETQVNDVESRRSGGDVAVEDPALPERAAGSLPGYPGERALPTGSDPLLQHVAATAVFQEINLLNRSVSQRVDFEGYEAFLVRLQLSVMPSRRNLPYDAITDITFHGRDIARLTGYAERGDFASSYDRRTGRPTTANNIPADTCRNGGNVRVLPMVVTDNLEGLAASRSSDIANQLGLALLATAGNVGLQGQFGLTRQALRAAIGRDMNSLFSVGRVTEDTIRVSLGATLRPGAEPALIKRSHNLSVVVLVKPCQWNREQIVTAVAKTSFSDVKSGQVLEPRSYRDIAVQIQRKIEGKYLFSDLHTADYFELYHLAALQNFADFKSKLVQYKYLRTACFAENRSDRRESADRRYGNRRELKAITAQEDAAGTVMMEDACPEVLQVANLIVPGVWSDLIGARPTGEFSYASVPLQIPRMPAFAAPPHDQIVVLTPGETDLSAKLAGGSILKSNRPTTAALYLNATQFVPATSVELAASQLTLRFPKAPRFDADSATMRIVVTYPNAAAAVAGGTDATITYADIQVAKKTDAAAGETAFRLDSGSSLIVAGADSGGTMNVVVSGGKTDSKAMKITVSGADIVSATAVRGTGIDGSGGVFTVKGNGETQFGLRNLFPGQVVRVQMVDDKDKPVGAALTRAVYWAGQSAKP